MNKQIPPHEHASNAECAPESPPQGRGACSEHVSAARAKTARGWLHSQARHIRICQSARGEKTGFRYSNARPFHPSEALPYKKRKSQTKTISRLRLYKCNSVNQRNRLTSPYFSTRTPKAEIRTEKRGKKHLGLFHNQGKTSVENQSFPPPLDAKPTENGSRGPPKTRISSPPPEKPPRNLWKTPGKPGGKSEDRNRTERSPKGPRVRRPWGRNPDGQGVSGKNPAERRHFFPQPGGFRRRGVEKRTLPGPRKTGISAPEGPVRARKTPPIPSVFPIRRRDFPTPEDTGTGKNRQAEVSAHERRTGRLYLL